MLDKHSINWAPPEALNLSPLDGLAVDKYIFSFLNAMLTFLFFVGFLLSLCAHVCVSVNIFICIFTYGAIERLRSRIEVLFFEPKELNNSIVSMSTTDSYTEFQACWKPPSSSQDKGHPPVCHPDFHCYYFFPRSLVGGDIFVSALGYSWETDCNKDSHLFIYLFMYLGHILPKDPREVSDFWFFCLVFPRLMDSSITSPFWVETCF